MDEMFVDSSDYATHLVSNTQIILPIVQTGLLRFSQLLTNRKPTSTTINMLSMIGKQKQTSGDTVDYGWNVLRWWM